MLLRPQTNAADLDTMLFMEQRLVDYLDEGLDGYASIALAKRDGRKYHEEQYLRRLGVKV